MPATPISYKLGSLCLRQPHSSTASLNATGITWHEKGFTKGISDNVKVIISRNDKEAFTIQPGNRGWVSIVECISTTNYVLPPFVIFPGQANTTILDR